MHATVAHPIFQNLMKSAERMQVGWPELLRARPRLRHVPVDPTALGGALGAELLAELWSALDEQADQPFLAQHIVDTSSDVGLGIIGVTGAVMATCRNVGELADLCRRFGHLLGVVFPTLRVGPEGVVLSYPVSDSTLSRLRSWNDCQVLGSLSFLERFTGRRWAPKEVRLSHAGRRDRLYDEAFDCPIRFASGRTELVFPRELATHPFLPVSEAITQFLRGHVDYLVSRCPPQRSFTALVVETLPQAFSSGRNVAEWVSQELGVSERSLRRYLRSEGTSLGELMASTRNQLAELHLEAGTHSVAEIAVLLGYGTARALAHAFVKWKGLTPAEYRRRHRRGEG
jgi:AraC-like DNA-binding protein